MGGLGVKVQHFPLTLLVVLTTLTLPCETHTKNYQVDGHLKFFVFYNQGCSGKFGFGGALVKYLGYNDGGTRARRGGAKRRSAKGGGVWRGTP